MNDIEETGGAKIGLAQATWPFATLTVNKNLLRINASILGNLYARCPKFPDFGRIKHVVSGYKNQKASNLSIQGINLIFSLRR